MLQTLNINSELIRNVLLLFPFLLAGGLFLFLDISKRQATSAFLGFMWNIPSLVLANNIAVFFGWWKFNTDELLVLGVPFDVVLGWAAFWGIVLYIVGRKLNIFLLVGIAILIDLVSMPASTPFIELGDHWLIGEAVTISTCLIPGLILSRLTENNTNIGIRATLQVIGTGGWFYILIPAVLLPYEGKTLFDIFELDTWQLALTFNALLLPVILGLSANREFMLIGCGTPIPFDPPKKLVTTGPYSYVANPMQISVLLTYLVLAAAYGSWYLFGAAAMSFIYAIGVVKWHQKLDIQIRFGEDWLVYKRNVKNWLPRWRPHIENNASIYFAKNCGICQDVKEKIELINTTHLLTTNTTNTDECGFDRVTYIDALDNKCKGIHAIGRSLEHANFAYGLIGFLIRLPVISQLLQLIIDGTGQRAQNFR